MKINWKTTGVIAISAALLYYPLKRLYDFLTRESVEDTQSNENNHDDHVMKAFAPDRSGKRKTLARHRQHHQVLKPNNN